MANSCKNPGENTQTRLNACSFSSSARRDVIPAGNRSPERGPHRYIVEVDDCLPECCMFNRSSKQHFAWLKLRCSIRCLVEHKYLEWFILFTVMFSSFVLVRQYTNLTTPTLNVLLEAIQIPLRGGGQKRARSRPKYFNIIRPVGSVRRAPDYRAGGRGIKPRPDLQ